MPPSDTAFNGLKLLAGLPVKNGLAPLADDLVDSPDSIVCVIATMRVKDLVAHVENDTTTAVLKLQQIEAMTGTARGTALTLLAKAREDRTGEKAMISESGEIILPESPPEEKVTGGDAPDEEPMPSNVRSVQFADGGPKPQEGEEWEDEQPPKPVADHAAQKAADASRKKRSGS